MYVWSNICTPEFLSQKNSAHHNFFFLEEKNPNEAISNACDICLWFHYFLSTVYPKPTNNTRISIVLPDYYTPISLIYYSNHRYSISSHQLKAAVFQNIDETEIESVFNFSLIWAILARAFNNEGDDIFIFIE